ncbi:MAG TPA: heme peroxidase family protein, partial [Blastocatellia bacterium]|nr:heme peroxidase family protein [Blastocatellia bacterium]
MKQFTAGRQLFVKDRDHGPELVHSPGSLRPSPEASPANSAHAYRYGRMLRKPGPLPEYRPEVEALMELGLSMEAQGDLGENPGLPSGYTYLGQFIDHDLTAFDSSTSLFEKELTPEVLFSNCTPSLDLDSLYGLGPELERRHPSGRRIYEDDGIKLRVGLTTGDPVVGIDALFPHDLPRGDDPQWRQRASIADPRNDENLVIAQTHVAFIRFHNAVVDRLAAEYPADQLFQAARRKVVQHYHWIILHDFLPRIIEVEALQEVRRNGCQFLVREPGEAPFMPVEFSFAVFRFGHSLVRNSYQWNRVFQSRPHGYHPAALAELLSNTGSGENTLAVVLKLPSSWIIDWTRFYDFTGFPGVENNPRSNVARRIGPSLSPKLMDLPTSPAGGRPFRSLAVLNLLRGRSVGLPSGQDVAERLGIQNALTPDEIASGPQGEVLKRHGFDRLTPLWYYILKEAEVRCEGRRLGPVGSRIVAETFIDLLSVSEHSILAEGKAGELIWRPDLGPVIPGRFLMSDLLFFLHRASETG